MGAQEILIYIVAAIAYFVPTYIGWYRKVDGITIPVRLEATWHLDDGPWTWLKMEIGEVEYTY